MASEQLGTLDGIPGLREPLPVLALRYRESSRGAQYGYVELAIRPQPGVLDRLLTIVRSDCYKFPRVTLDLRSMAFTLRNVILNSVMKYTGNPVGYNGPRMGFHFELDPGLDRHLTAW